jgi:hypothetical protein
MINSYEELVQKLQSLDLGSTTLEISASNRNLSLLPSINPAKLQLESSQYWLDRNILHNLYRKFDTDTKTWCLRQEALGKVKQGILNDFLIAMKKCSKASLPERTSLYKEYVLLNDKQFNNPHYLTDIIAIMNYYSASRTDAICKSNVIGLLHILRKKYNGKSS